MKTKEFTFTTPDKAEIFAKKYFPENPAKAIIIIVHGMAEHSLRYSGFADFLTKNNFAVYAHDQRGHGKTAGKIENLGFFAKKNGWQKVTDDVKQLLEIVQKENPDIPVFILGHSMGSFITRNFISQYDNKIKGVLLSGTAGSAGLLGKIGISLTSLLKFINTPLSASPLMNNMSFGDFNKKFKPNRTKFDWLSRDEKNVDKYINDPFCGTVFTIGFFNDLLTGLENANKLSNAEKIRKDLAVYIFSGSKDPVSKDGKDIPKVYDMYKKAGIKNITMKLYKDGRHEMLNETNRDEVYKDIINWLNKNV